MSYNHMMTGMYLALQFDFRDDEMDNDMDGGAKGKKKWTTLEHNGVLFPKEYTATKIPVIYNGEKIVLSPEAEQCATLYAKFIMTDYVKNSVFRKNFWNDWKKILGPDHKIKDLAGCDFTLIYEHLLKEKEEKKLIPKDKTDTSEDKYKTAIVDGKKQPVGNYKIEPTGLFLGRGCNPNIGRIKRSIYPEDITINIGKNVTIPEPLPGHQWGSIIHDNTVEWLASWKDDISGKTKYVWLGAHSDQKALHDKEKFDLARKLKKKIKLIRAQYESEFKSSDKKMKQLSTALYFIDKFALRVGNEKGDDETDTVGVSSLRVEHIEPLGENKIRLTFLGKDSIKYDRLLNIDHNAYVNIEEFMLNKEMGSQLFDLVTSTDINNYLKSFLSGLSAKVFRTFQASDIFQKELKKISNKLDTYEESDKINLLLDEFNKANSKVALLCNHQRNSTKSNTQITEKINESIKKLKAKIRKASTASKKNPAKITEMKNKLKKLRAKKEMMIEVKNLALGTSKANYLDPRISISYLRKHKIPVEKIFSASLIKKFQWAFDVDENFKF